MSIEEIDKAVIGYLIHSGILLTNTSKIQPEITEDFINQLKAILRNCKTYTGHFDKKIDDNQYLFLVDSEDNTELICSISHTINKPDINVNYTVLHNINTNLILFYARDREHDTVRSH